MASNAKTALLLARDKCQQAHPDWIPCTRRVPQTGVSTVSGVPGTSWNQKVTQNQCWASVRIPPSSASFLLIAVLDHKFLRLSWGPCIASEGGSSGYVRFRLTSLIDSMMVWASMSRRATSCLFKPSGSVLTSPARWTRRFAASGTSGSARKPWTSTLPPWSRNARTSIVFTMAPLFGDFGRPGDPPAMPAQVGLTRMVTSLT